MSVNGGAGRGRPFDLGPWRVEPGLDRLCRGSESVALEPRAMDLLLCLAQRAGETVSKETLLEEVWRGAFVVEGVIPKTLSGLRAALGDDAAAPTFILTVPRRGYRLVAPVRWLAEAERRAPDGQEDPLAASARAAAIFTLAPAAEGESGGAAGSPPIPELSTRAIVESLPPQGLRRRHLLATGLGLLMAGVLGWLLFASAERPARVPAPAPPEVSDAVSRLLLEARHLWAQRGLDSVRRAADLMQRAVQEAPRSAEAHAWLALSTITRASYGGGGAAVCEQAAAAARRAIELSPEDPIALCAQGVMAIQQAFDPPAAIVALERSVAADPTFVPARQFLAEALTLSNQNERALAAIDQALALDPLSALLHGVRGNILIRADRPLAALEAYERVLVLEPQFTWIYRNRARPLVELGRQREAVESLYTEARLTGERPEYLATLRTAIDADGLAGYYRWRLGRIETLLAQGFELRPFQYAEALAGAGQSEAALSQLAKAPVCPDADTFFYGRSSPAFDGLRDDPRFIAVYARFGL